MPTELESGRARLPDAMLTRRAITVVTAVIAGLAFAVSLGDTAALCRHVGLAPWIRWLIGPMVDLSVVGLLIGLRFLALAGAPDLDTVMPRCLLAFCGLLTLALNTADAWAHRQVGTALVQTVAPCLLMIWSSVGPWLLRAMHQATLGVNSDDVRAAHPTRAGARPMTLPAVEGNDGVSPSPCEGQVDPDLSPDTEPSSAQHSAVDLDLLEQARRLDIEHRASCGRPISRDVLRARMRISRDRASDLVAALRGEAAQAARTAGRLSAVDAADARPGSDTANSTTHDLCRRAP